MDTKVRDSSGSFYKAADNKVVVVVLLRTHV